MNEILLADSVSRVGQIVVNCFAVGGAFLAGNYGTAGMLASAKKMALNKGLPPWANTWSRFSGGSIAAIIAALILFGDGGFGLGGSGGGKPGGPQSDKRIESAQEKPNAVETEKKKDAVIPSVTPEEIQSEYRIRIVVLGGEQKEERYYLVEDQKEPITFDRLKDELLMRQKDEKRPLQRIDILVYKDTAYRESYLIKQLEAWAKENHLSVNFPSLPPGEAMPPR